MSGYQIRVLNASLDNLQGGTFTVNCADGTLALSGGVQDLTHSNGLTIQASYPSPGGAGWETVIENTGRFADTEQLRGYVVCAAAS